MDLTSLEVTPSITEKTESVTKLPNGEGLESSSVGSAKSRRPCADETDCSSVNEGTAQSLIHSFNNVTLDVKSGFLKNLKTTRASSHAQYKPETWMLPQQEGIMTQLNLAIVSQQFG